MNPLKAIRHLTHLGALKATASLLMGREPDESRYDLRKDTRGDPGMNVAHWTALVVGAMVLVIVVAALLGPLKTNLTKYAANDTTFGPILQTIVPILIGVGILLAFVGAFIGASKLKEAK